MMYVKGQIIGAPKMDNYTAPLLKLLGKVMKSTMTSF